MVQNLYVSPFLWILEQILSKNKLLKIPRFSKQKIILGLNQKQMTESSSNFVPKLYNYPRAPKIRPIEAL